MVPPDVLVTRQLAARANLAVGDIVTFATDPAGAQAAKFRVAGIYEPTPDPMRFTAERMEARMHLPDLVGHDRRPVRSRPTSSRSTRSTSASSIPRTQSSFGSTCGTACRDSPRIDRARSRERPVRRAGPVPRGDLHCHGPRRHGLPAGADDHPRRRATGDHRPAPPRRHLATIAADGGPRRRIVHRRDRRGVRHPHCASPARVS